MNLLRFLGRLGLGRNAGQAGSKYPQALLLPLDQVLMPGGIMPVSLYGEPWRQWVEQEPTDALAVCLRLDSARAEQVDASAVHSVGVLARIVERSWESNDKKVAFTLCGGSRIRILGKNRGKSGWPQVHYQFLQVVDAHDAGSHLQAMLPLLKQIIEDLGPERAPPPHRYDDANWIGYRFSEALPIPALARQKLLELDDPLERLEIIYRYMVGRGLLGKK